MIIRPMKAPGESITNEQLVTFFNHCGYGLQSPKLDGYLCLTQGAVAHTSSMKPIANKYIQSILSRPEYDGLQGEIVVGDPTDGPIAFNRTTSQVKRAAGEPDFKLYVFDSIAVQTRQLIYSDRSLVLSQYPDDIPFLMVLPQIKVTNPTEVIAYDKKCADWGFEGSFLHNPNGLYKEGKCTLKEMNAFKRKPREDDEGVVVGYEEQFENLNKKTTNEMGLSTRSSHKGNKVGKNTLGTIILDSKLWKEPIRISTGQGWDKNFRDEVWNNKEKFMGELMTYTYQAYGSIDAPRQPIGKGWRDPNDMTNY